MKHQLHILKDQDRAARSRHLAELLKHFEEEGLKVLVIMPTKLSLATTHHLPALPILTPTTYMPQHDRWAIIGRTMFRLEKLDIGNYFDVIICTHLECFTNVQAKKFQLYLKAIHNDKVQRNIVICRSGGQVPPDNARWLLVGLLKMDNRTIDRALQASIVPRQNSTTMYRFDKRVYPENWWSRLVHEFWGEQVIEVLPTAEISEQSDT